MTVFTRASAAVGTAALVLTLGVPASGQPTIAAARTYDGSDADLSYFHEYGSAPPGGATTVDFNCPSGTHVVGVGGDSGGTDPGYQLNTLIPTDGSDADTRPDDGVEIRATNGDPTYYSGPLAAAVCSTSSPSYVVGHATVPAGQWFVGKAHCGSGTRVTGGGVEVSGAAGAGRLVSSTPYDDSDTNTRPDDGWRSVVFNSGGASHDVTYVAICSAALVLSYNQGSFSAVTGATGSGQTCLNSTDALISGGLTYSGDRSQFLLQRSQPTDGADTGTIPDDFWSLAWSNYDTAHQVKVTAVCEVLA